MSKLRSMKFPTVLVGFAASLMLFLSVPLSGQAQTDGTCNPSYPAASSNYLYNQPCTGAESPTGGLNTNYADCNPYFPSPQPAYPNYVPCGDAQGQPCYSDGVAPSYNYLNDTPDYPVDMSSDCAVGYSVAVAQISSGTAAFGWPAMEGATSYTIAVVSPMQDNLETISGTSATLDGLVPGYTYTFSVAANGPWGLSAAMDSNPVTIAY